MFVEAVVIIVLGNGCQWSCSPSKDVILHKSYYSVFVTGT